MDWPPSRSVGVAHCQSQSHQHARGYCSHAGFLDRSSAQPSSSGSASAWALRINSGPLRFLPNCSPITLNPAAANASCLPLILAETHSPLPMPGIFNNCSHYRKTTKTNCHCRMRMTRSYPRRHMMTRMKSRCQRTTETETNCCRRDARGKIRCRRGAKATPPRHRHHVAPALDRLRPAWLMATDRTRDQRSTRSSGPKASAGSSN
jgi:hypothetical protein